MKPVEIEKKYLVDEKSIPVSLDQVPFLWIQQAYLCTDPVVRVRKSNDDYYLTYKGKGMMEREEYNLPLNKTAYEHLLKKADGNIITKTRYLIPYSCESIPGKNLTIELDVFEDKFYGTIIAEVEFQSVEDADNFTPPEWFGKDVTYDKKYHNSNMSRQ